MIPDGKYRARGVSAGLGHSSKGTEQIAVEFELLDADGTPGEHITWFGYFTDATFERTVKSLRACGWRGEDLSDLSGVTDNEVELVLQSEPYEGKVRQKVAWVNAPGGSGLALKAPMDATAAKSFAAKMKGRIVALEQGGSRPPQKKANSRKMPISDGPPPHDDTDMPPF